MVCVSIWKGATNACCDGSVSACCDGPTSVCHDGRTSACWHGPTSACCDRPTSVCRDAPKQIGGEMYGCELLELYGQVELFQKLAKRLSVIWKVSRIEMPIDSSTASGSYKETIKNF